MSWVNKAHKKNQVYNLVEQAMKDPRIAETQKQREKEILGEAFNSFLLISADYLYRDPKFDRETLMDYLEFVLNQTHFAEGDTEYFRLLNEALADETGIDILNSKFKEDK
jgi:hypothetical protein